MTDAPVCYGDRLWRSHAEQAGRLLRSQAARKKQFALILPILEQGMLRPKSEQRPAGKHRQAIKVALAARREEESDGGKAVELQSLIEHSCNFSLKNGCFPSYYEEMQPIPVLAVGILPDAADDGGEQGQADRFRLDLEGHCCSLSFRASSVQGVWAKGWTEPQWYLPLPDPVVERLKNGACLAPTLREVQEPDGIRYGVLDLIVEVPVVPVADPQQVYRSVGVDWGVRTLVTAVVVDLSANRLSPPLFLDTGGFDGRQAHMRRHLDQRKKKVAKLEAQRDRFPVGDKRREPSERKLAVLRREIASGWRKSQNRNEDLAHLAATMLILLAHVWEADLIAGESLTSLKSEGRGRSAKGRWMRWRNTSHIRGTRWNLLRDTCHLSGLRLVWQHPRGTTHSCPTCGQAASTSADRALDAKHLDAGPWVRCFSCGWNAARDDAAAITVALLGVPFLLQERAHHEHHGQHRRAKHPTMKTKALNSGSSIGSGLALRLPPTSPRGRLHAGGKSSINGWITSVTLHSALSQETMLRLCG